MSIYCDKFYRDECKCIALIKKLGTGTHKNQFRIQYQTITLNLSIISGFGHKRFPNVPYKITLFAHPTLVLKA